MAILVAVLFTTTGTISARFQALLGHCHILLQFDQVKPMYPRSTFPEFLARSLSSTLAIREALLLLCLAPLLQCTLIQASTPVLEVMNLECTILCRISNVTNMEREVQAYPVAINAIGLTECSNPNHCIYSSPSNSGTFSPSRLTIILG